MRWKDCNGWADLFALSPGSIPGLSPFWLTIEVPFAGGAPDNQTENFNIGSAVVTSEAELFILGGVAGGWSPDNLTVNEGLGVIPEQSPDMFPARVSIRDGNGGRTISAGPCSIGHLFGGGPRPYIWPAPWRVQPGTELTVTLLDTSTISQFVQLTLFGFKRYLSEPEIPIDFLLDPRLVRLLSKYRASGRNVQPEPFFYPLAWAGTTDFNAGTQSEGRSPFQTESRTFAVTEADFACVHLAGSIYDPAPDVGGASWIMNNILENNVHASVAPGGAPLVGNGVSLETVRIITQLGRERLDDRPVGLGALFGTGRDIGRYASPLVIPKGDSLSAILNFKDSSQGNNFPLRADLTFGGVRLVES